LRLRLILAVSPTNSCGKTINAEHAAIANDERRDETAESRRGYIATCVRRSHVFAASNGAPRVATRHLQFINVRAIYASDDIVLESLRQRLRKMLIGRWKSKDKSSAKSSSSSGGAGKKKRKFGREGKTIFFVCLSYIIEAYLCPIYNIGHTVISNFNFNDKF